MASDFKILEEGIALLRRCVAARESAPDLPALTALAERIECYLNGAPQGMTLEKALGIAPAPNGAPWYLAEARERRNSELRTLTGRFCPVRGSVRSRALWLRGRIVNYSSASWPRDRGAAEMPQRYLNTERQHLFRAFSASPPPFSERRLRAIISAGEVGNVQAVPVANNGR